MRSFVLDIVVIELCSVGGCPLEEASEHCSQQSKCSFQYYFGIILVLLWYCSGYIIVSLPFLAKIFMFCILFYIWNTTSGIKAPSSTKNCGLIFFQGRDVFRRLKATEICRYAHKPAVGESYTQEIQVVLKYTYVGHPCNPCWYPFKWQCIREHLCTDRPRLPEAIFR